MPSIKKDYPEFEKTIIDLSKKYCEKALKNNIPIDFIKNNINQSVSVLSRHVHSGQLRIDNKLKAVKKDAINIIFHCLSIIGLADNTLDSIPDFQMFSAGYGLDWGSHKGKTNNRLCELADYHFTRIKQDEMVRSLDHFLYHVFLHFVSEYKDFETGYTKKVREKVKKFYVNQCKMVAINNPEELFEKKERLVFNNLHVDMAKARKKQVKEEL